MTKPKYATEAERKAAASASAKKQMLAQWERQRQETGQELGYFGCHRRVRSKRGRASDQNCGHCGRQAQHWAHVHDTDPSSPENYMPLCQSCHWRYDDVAARVTEATGPEGRRALAVLAWSRRSPERRSEIAKKMWETRRRNREQASGEGPAHGAGA